MRLRFRYFLPNSQEFSYFLCFSRCCYGKQNETGLPFYQHSAVPYRPSAFSYLPQSAGDFSTKVPHSSATSLAKASAPVPARVWGRSSVLCELHLTMTTRQPSAVCLLHLLERPYMCLAVDLFFGLRTIPYSFTKVLILRCRSLRSPTISSVDACPATS